MKQTHLVVAGVALAALFAIAPAGELTPPGGSVGQTMKTLDEIEPRIPVTSLSHDANSLFKITQPGSYYLTENITGRAGYHGIEIASSDVTLDLMGFTLRGVADSLDGITTDGAAHSRIYIYNGTVRDWDEDGISLSQGSAYHISDVIAYANQFVGFRCFSDATLERCSAHYNGDHGFDLNSGAIMRECTAANNTGAGIHAASGIWIGCRSVGNGGDGFLSYGTLSDCVAKGNGGIGFLVSSASAIMNCRSMLNGEHGYRLVNDGYAVANCTAESNTGSGFVAASNASVRFVGCSAKENGASGFDTVTGSSFEACDARDNDLHGFDAGYANTITHCSATSNTGDGFRISYDSMILACTADSNGFDTGDGAGIHAVASDNRIEGNNVIDNDRGIECDSSVNLIIRNSASGNTINYDIGASNAAGPILSPADLATNTNPHANYEY